MERAPELRGPTAETLGPNGRATAPLRFWLAAALAVLLSFAGPAWGQADPGRAAFERGDYAAALRLWKPRAEEGIAAAQYNLGVLYRYGLGVEESFAEAAKWFERAAAQGDADSQLALGDLYAKQSSSAEDDLAAAGWYRRAAEQGLAEAQRKLGLFYVQGRGVPQDRAEASRWLAEAAEQGDADAQAWLAKMPWQGPKEQAMAEQQVTGTDCPGDLDDSYKLKMHLDIPRARLHEDHSIAELGEMSFHGPRSRVLGLASTNLEFGWHVQFAAKPFGDGHCFWVTRADLSLRYAAPDIYVAREYRPGSCPYRAVLQHEEEHVAITRGILERYAPRLETALTSLLVPTGTRPIVVDSPEAAKHETSELMKELVKPIYQEMVTKLREAHRELDSPRGYRNTFRRCPSW